jgi:hypothetical protein
MIIPIKKKTKQNTPNNGIEKLWFKLNKDKSTMELKTLVSS